MGFFEIFILFILPVVFGIIAFFVVTTYMTNKHPGKMNSPKQRDVILGLLAGVLTCIVMWFLIRMIIVYLLIKAIERWFWA